MKRHILAAFLISCVTPSFAQYSWEAVPFPDAMRYKADTVSVHIIGDVMMHKGQISCDFTTFLQDIAPQMRAADISVANMEFPLGGAPYSGYPCFSAPDSYAEYVAGECGTDLFLTANNHILDRGATGLTRTLSVYDTICDSLGTRFTGTSRHPSERRGKNPIIIEKRGIKLAFINFTYDTNVERNAQWPHVETMDRDDIRQALVRAREQKADFIIVLPHWGTEYSLRHDRDQEEWAEWLASEGADVIVGTHPHVIQDTTHIRNVPVIYSIGNAVSNMSAPNTRLELAVTLRFITDPATAGKRMLEPELEFLWCTLPGRLVRDSYATISVKKWATRRSEWLTPSDFDNMLETLSRVKAVTGIAD